MLSSDVEGAIQLDGAELGIMEDKQLGCWVVAGGRDWDVMGPSAKTRADAIRKWNAMLNSIAAQVRAHGERPSVTDGLSVAAATAVQDALESLPKRSHQASEQTEKADE